MAKRMLIDATHAEETRVVVTNGKQLEEFDFESQARKQLAGNIYLAQVTRVEPSLQAAFVDYGGNRHGFLAFNEIHPDYYQISAEERRAILEAQEAAYARDDDDDNTRSTASKKTEKRSAASRNIRNDKHRGRKRRTRRERKDIKERVNAERVILLETGGEAKLYAANAQIDLMPPKAQEILLSDGQIACLYPYLEPVAIDPDPQDSHTNDDALLPPPTPKETAVGNKIKITTPKSSAPQEPSEPKKTRKAVPARRSRLLRSFALENGTIAKLYRESQPRPKRSIDQAADMHATIQSPPLDQTQTPTQAANTSTETRPMRGGHYRRYRIQDVIKRRQILLVQVVKEERGTKGAALTTYLSIPGRYCVLMPNTTRGGGISRKISNPQDRKRLKDFSQTLNIPKGVGLIIRTAGAERDNEDIHRDYAYLMRQWNAIRTRTMKSFAPTLIYEEGSLIKRAIRDLYADDLVDIQVEGQRGYEEARDYMQMISPENTQNVHHYRERVPLFTQTEIEPQLSAMFSPNVPLPSGGYLVIGITEALVAIDINSGRSTKEGSVEDTALSTNLEAATEIARQLRLRDLAGLIVIDFIDMLENRNNRAVEKRLREAVKDDRARIQLGRISSFGLLEMSRQRLRPGMLEAATSECTHCQGTGITRSEDSLALSILRKIEGELAYKRADSFTIKVPVSIANYLVNRKRGHIYDLEQRNQTQIFIEADQALQSPHFAIEHSESTSRSDSWESSKDSHANTKQTNQQESVILEEKQVTTDQKEPLDRYHDDEDSPRRRGRRGGRKRRREEPSKSMQVIDVSEKEKTQTAPQANTKDFPSKPHPKSTAPHKGRHPNRRPHEKRGAHKRRADDPARLDPLFVKNRLMKRPDVLDLVMPLVFGEFDALETNDTNAQPSSAQPSDTDTNPAVTPSSAHPKMPKKHSAASDTKSAADSNTSKHPKNKTLQQPETQSVPQTVAATEKVPQKALEPEIVESNPESQAQSQSITDSITVAANTSETSVSAEPTQKRTTRKKGWWSR